MIVFDYLFRLANRLTEVEAGSIEADRTIHRALGREGRVPAYTRDEAAARLLLPDGFEWMAGIHSGLMTYIACRRSGMDGEGRYPHYGQFGRTLPVALCGAALRARAGLLKG